MKSDFAVKAGDRGQPATVMGTGRENKNNVRYTDFVCDNAGLLSPAAIVDGDCNNGLLCGGAVNVNNLASNANWNISARTFL